METDNSHFNFTLRTGITYIQEMKPDSTISIGYENEKWWCELSPEGHTTYSNDNVFSALHDMGIWASKY